MPFWKFYMDVRHSNPEGHSKPTYFSPETPKTPKFFMRHGILSRFFDFFPCILYACKLQNIYPWSIINNVRICRKNAASYCKYAEYAGNLKEYMLMISKKKPWSIKIDRICRKKCNIVIRRSKNTSFILSMYVHICNIYSAYMCV